MISALYILLSGLLLFLCTRILDPSESLALSGVLSTTVIICHLLRTRTSSAPSWGKICHTTTFGRMETILFFGACIAASPVLASELGRLLYVKNIELFSPQPYNVMEGVEATKTALLAYGTNLYTNCSGYQYLVTIYPPLYYVFSSLIFPLLNDALISNRVTSAAATLGLFFSIYLISFRITRNHFATATATLTILLSPALGTWFVLGRPDMLVWCLALLSIYFIAYPGSASFTLMSGASVALSVLVKQQALPVFVANAIYLTATKRRRDLAIYIFVSLAILSTVIIIFNHISNGMFLHNIYDYPKLYSASDEYVNKWLKLLHFKSNFLKDYISVFIFTLLSIWADIHNRRVSLFSLCFIISLASLYMLLGTWGFATNYIMFTVVMMYLVILNTLHYTFKNNKPSICAFIILFICTNHEYINNKFFDYEDAETSIRKEMTVYKEEIVKAEFLLSLTENTVLSDTDSGFFLTNKPYFKNIKFFDGNHMTLYTNLFHYDFNSSQIIEDISVRKFNYIILYPGAVHPKKIIETIKSTYTPIIDGKYVTMYFIAQ